MRLIISGTRDGKFPKLAYHFEVALKLAFTHKFFEMPSEVVEGGCPTGIDALARKWAEDHGMTPKTFDADWTRFGYAAGPIRNREMANYGEALLAIPATPRHRKSGTWNMVAQAEARGLIIYVYEGLFNGNETKAP